MSDFILDSVPDSGDNPITLYPSWNYSENEMIQRAASRSIGGLERVYDWADFKNFQVPVTFINSSTKLQINQWWRNNVSLTFTTDAGDVQCRIANAQQPIGTPQSQANKGLWRGTLFLTALDGI